MSGHTAGPWTPDNRAMSVWAEDHRGKFPVCDIRGWGHLTGCGHGALGLPHAEAVAIQTANARLIAAAPDLLAALINLCEADRDDLNDSASEVWQQAHAALNKAIVIHTSAMRESK